MALMMNEHINSNKYDPKLDDFIKTNNFDDPIKKRSVKLESADDVWETIESDVGADNAKIILAVLK